MSDSSKRKPANQPPVSAHPAFPVIVAVWFAALLGIGSWVLPLELFERLSIAIGLADSFEAAQPPLGMTARIIVAGAAAVIGALAGIYVSSRIAAANKAAPTLRQRPASAEAADDFAKRPISAHEELGEGGFDAGALPLDASEPVAGRRRALAVAEECAPLDFVEFAPLPAQRNEDEPLDLEAFAAIEEAPLADEAGPSEFEPEEPIEFELDRTPPPATEESPAPFVRTEESAPPPVARLAERPLGELGIVELVERFALALQRHRDASIDRPVSIPETAATQGIPAALRPIDFDDDEAHASDLEPHTALPAEFDEEAEEIAEGYPSLLAMKNPQGQSREPVRMRNEASEGNAAAEPVAIFTGQALRQAASPAAGVTHSSHAPVDRGQTERALREALEKLQNLSGAA